jgi:hypothetical protein
VSSGTNNKLQLLFCNYQLVPFFFFFSRHGLACRYPTDSIIYSISKHLRLRLGDRDCCFALTPSQYSHTGAGHPKLPCYFFTHATQHAVRFIIGHFTLGYCHLG